MGNIRAILKLKNDALLSAIERMGYSQSRLAKLAGVHPAQICDMVNLRYCPIENSEKELRITTALKSDYETLFRPYEDVVKFKKRGFIKPKYEAQIEISKILESSETALQIEAPEIFTDDFDTEVREIFERILSKREQYVVVKFFGLFGHEPLILEQLGVILKLTRERVRQIKEKSLLRLRRCPKADILREYLGDKF